MTDMLMDMQFACIKAALLKRQVNLNCASAKEHIGEIEHFVRMIKERIQAARSRLPYEKLPK